MTRRFLDRESRVAHRWPYRFLNFLPSRHLWRYLAWQSGGDGPQPPFEVAKALSGCGSVLMVLPEDREELLVALPVVLAHFHGRPKAALWLIAGPVETPFLTGIFGKERLLTLDPGRFFFGEDHFKDILSRIQGMRADLVINFRADSPPLLHYVLRSSLAPLRIHFGNEAEAHWPFSNITLAASEPVNHLRHFQMATRLWEAAGITMAGNWTRMAPPPEAMAQAETLLKAAGLKPEATVLFPWQDRSARYQIGLLETVARKCKEEGRRVAVLLGEEGLFASPVPPLEVTAAYPCLKTDSPPVLLALFVSTAATVGMNGPLLLLAGMTDTDVTGYFLPEDTPFDTSFLNPRLRIVALEMTGAAD